MTDFDAGFTYSSYELCKQSMQQVLNYMFMCVCVYIYIHDLQAAVSSGQRRYKKCAHFAFVAALLQLRSAIS